MLVRSSVSGALLLICLGFCACNQGGEGQVDEQKNPYFIAGKERAAERDYKGAIDAFEKALEANSHSAQAHFELGVLYELHSDQKEEDYVSAMYHYNEAIKLRPNDHPADNARQRIAYCKRELVKGEALAPVAQNLMHDLERLKEENKLLRKQLDSCQIQPTTRATSQSRTPTNSAVMAKRPLLDRMPIQARTPPERSDGTSQSSAGLRPSDDSNLLSRPFVLGPTRERITPLPPVASAAGRTHSVKERETFFSIARQYHLKPDALIAANPTIDPKRLKIGQLVNIPSP